MSGEKMRLFVAADIPGDVRELLASAVQGIRGEELGARWVRLENLHLTLKFIGDYEKDEMDRLSNEVRATAQRCEPFEALLGGSGAFPSPRRARIIWVAVSSGVREAEAVARKLNARLEKVGVKKEERAFRGHLTLARLRQVRDCTAMLAGVEGRLEGLRDMPFRVDEVVLYRSILKPEGPVYSVVERMALGG